MPRHLYTEIPWTLQVPIFCEAGQIATLVDFDCTLSFHGNTLEGVEIAIETIHDTTIKHEIGCNERDHNLRAIWNAAKHEVATESRLQHELADRRRETSYERAVCAAEHAWEQNTGR